MNYSFKLANLEVNVPDLEAVVRVGELSINVTDMNLVDSLNIMREMPKVLREFREMFAELNKPGTHPTPTPAPVERSDDAKQQDIDAVYLGGLLAKATEANAERIQRNNLGNFRYQSHWFRAVDASDQLHANYWIKLIVHDGYSLWLKKITLNDVNFANMLRPILQAFLSPAKASYVDRDSADNDDDHESEDTDHDAMAEDALVAVTGFSRSEFKGEWFYAASYGRWSRGENIFIVFDGGIPTQSEDDVELQNIGIHEGYTVAMEIHDRDDADYAEALADKYVEKLNAADSDDVESFNYTDAGNVLAAVLHTSADYLAFTKKESNYCCWQYSTISYIVADKEESFDIELWEPLGEFETYRIYVRAKMLTPKTVTDYTTRVRNLYSTGDGYRTRATW